MTATLEHSRPTRTHWLITLYAGGGELCAAIVAAARPYLDGVDWEARRDEWVGSRPMTPDGLPAIGRLPGHRNVVVASGHNMLGLMLAPATGRLVAGLVANERPGSAAFDPARIARRRPAG